MRDILIKESWFPKANNLTEEEKKEIGYRIFKYGCLEEDVEDSDINIVDMLWERAKQDIDRMSFSKKQKEEYGKIAGKQSQADPVLVWQYCQDHPKCLAEEVGNGLGLKPSLNAKKPWGFLYENAGWKNRKNPNWLKENSKKENSGNSNLDSKMDSNLENSGMENGQNLENPSNEWNF